MAIEPMEIKTSRDCQHSHKASPTEQQTTGNVPDTIQGVQTTPVRGGKKHSTSSLSQARKTTGTYDTYRAKDMSGPIAVDLAGAQECKAADMIRFLLAFSGSTIDKTVPVCDEDLLRRAFSKAKEVANQEGTALRTNLARFLKAKKEIDMYGPFVRACNYALDKFSDSQIEGLSEFNEDKRLVFVCRHNRSVGTEDHARESRVMPDIVLLPWGVFNEPEKAPYSASYEGNICTDKPDVDLVWGLVRSTVEMKLVGLQKHRDWKAFDMEFGDLVESAPYASLNDCENQKDGFIDESLPNYNHATVSSARIAAKKGPLNADKIRMSSDKKRRTSVLSRDVNTDIEQPAAKRTKSESSKAQTQSGVRSGKGGAGTPQPPAISKKRPVNIQNGIYAAERLSCSLDVTHSINFILRGTTIYMTWSDRHSVIRTCGFDIINNLPHFLLILLIIQRFDLGRWGFFTEFEGSKIRQSQEHHKFHVLEATFIPNRPLNIFPQDDPIHSGINLVGRSTGAAGARNVSDDPIPALSEDIRRGNNVIVKFSWPEETRDSEVKIIVEATRIGETNELVRDRLPKMLGDIDPPYVTCSTKIIRTFLGLKTTGARVLRVIAFERLKELRYLDEEDMLIAFLDCFFCHWALWCEGIQHGDISIGNLMYDLNTRRGVLNDFDLARLRRQDGEPSGKDNTGTMPFMALDLLNPEAFQGMVPRRYRHDAESFAWCLVYICICMKKDKNGKICVVSPHPLSSWFSNPDASSRSKTEGETVGLLAQVHLHKNSKLLATALRHHWVTRFTKQTQATSSASVGHPEASEDLPESLKEKYGRAVPTVEAYEEPVEHESFKEVYLLFFRWNSAVPSSKKDIFFDMLRLARRMYNL